MLVRQDTLVQHAPHICPSLIQHPDPLGTGGPQRLNAHWQFSLWEATQWIQAADRAAESALESIELVGLESPLLPYINQTASGRGSEIIASLQDDGLPELEKRILKELGWSDAEIENVRQNLLELGADGLNSLTLAPLLHQMTALVSAFSAVEELAIGIDIEINELGQAKRDLTFNERQGLDAKRDAVAAELVKPIYGETLFNDIH